MQKQSAGGIDGRAVLERMQEAHGVKTLASLAEALGENTSTVKGWSQRGSVPLEPCVRTAQDRNCSLDWLLLGLGPQSLAPTSKQVDFQDPTGRRGIVTGGRSSGKTGAYTSILRALLEPGTESHDRWSKFTGPSVAGGPPRQGDALLPVAVVADHLPTLELQVSIPGTGSDFGYRVIPAFVGSASAGRGNGESGPQAVDQAGEMAFSHEWLRRNLGHTSGDLASIQIRGDSMSPTLIDGESIIVDRAVRRVDVNGIYVMNLRGDRLVKRIQRKLDQSLVIMSDNTQYARETLPGTRAEEIEIIGRMVWPRVR